MIIDLTSDTPLNRRGMIRGAGVAALAVGALAAISQPAGANPPTSPGPGLQSRAARSGSISTKDATPVQPGYVYRGVGPLDFTLLYSTSTRSYGTANGVYSVGGPNYLVAGVDLPGGGRVREVDFYVANTSGNSVPVDVYVVQPATDFVADIGNAAVTGASTTALVSVTGSASGPYPPGTQILLQVTVPAGNTVQVLGARVAFTHAAGSVGLLPASQRVYDSRAGSGTPFPAGGTRTLTLPSEFVPAGTAGVLLNVSAVGAAAKGYLKVWSADGSMPAATALNYTAGTSIANAVTVAVSTGRQIKVKASQPVDVVVDLVGVLA